MDIESARPIIGIFLIFLIVLAILWFLLPFAIFGTKDKLQELIEENKKLNSKIDEVIALIKPK